MRSLPHQRAAAEIIVVGGGPAGAGTAFQLAQRGHRVRVLERARMPRAKPCAECLSPQASRILADMGILTELEAQAARMRGMVVRAPDGALARGDYAAVRGFVGFRDHGLAIRREILDETLLRRAAAAGSVVEERARVTDVVRDGDGRVRGVRLLGRSGRDVALPGAMVVGADGLRSVVGRRLGLTRIATWPRRLALVAHYRGVGGVSDVVEMHVERDGFVGIADVGDGVTTVAAVFPWRRGREIRSDRAAFLDGWLAARPQLAARFAGASRLGSVAAVGPFAARARRAWHEGALLVGDAADFFDPFTGEGIYAALRGGELAAAAIDEIAADPARSAAALRRYERRRRDEFGGKWWVERFVGLGVAIPTVTNRAVRAMARHKPLADLLAGVTGDFVPASAVLNLGYLARLFVWTRPLADSPA